MAVSLKPFVGTTATVVTAGTAVAPLLLVPDNCNTIIITNTAVAATIVYAGWFPTAAAFNTAQAAYIPGGASASFAIGSKSARPSTGSAAGVQDSLFLDASVNGTVVRIVYVNGSST